LEHNHSRIADDILRRQEVSNSLERKAEETFSMRPSDLIYNEIKKNDEETDFEEILQMENITRIRKNIHTARLKNYRLPKNVQETHNVLRPGSGQYTVKTNEGENFLHYNNDADDNIIVFTCATNLSVLQTAKEIFVDGTFKSCPKFFKQMFSGHVLKNDWYVPLVFFLLADNSKESYIRAFSIIREYVTASTVYTDFEQAIHTAVLKV